MASEIRVNSLTNRSGLSTVSITNTGVVVAGILTANTGTFSGNVSVGGTLTYEDVTNIDAVGIITAQAGIHVTGGSVGIGTDNPALKLHVEDSSSQIIRFARTGIGAGSLDIDIDGNATLNSHTTSAAVVFHTQTTERLRITSAGRLLVGAATATNNSIAEFSKSVGSGAAGCHVTVENTSSNSVNNTAGIHLKTDQGVAKFFAYRAAETYLQSRAGGASDLLLQADGASNLKLFTNGSERLRITSAGNIGIGDNSPDHELVVRGSQPFLEIRDNRNQNWSQNDVFSGILFSSEDVYGGNQNQIPHGFIKAVHTRAGSNHATSDAGLTFGTSASTTSAAIERLRITDSGHVLPATNNAYDLGSVTNGWRNVYSNDLNLSNMNGDSNDIDGTNGSWTIQEGKDDLFLINRLTGKKYKFNLTEVS